MSSKDIFIVSGRRTPIGALNGALSGLQAHELGAIAIRAALEDAGVDPQAVDEATWGRC